jgi:hypothetical protein
MCSGCGRPRVSMSPSGNAWPRTGSCTTQLCRNDGTPGKCREPASLTGTSRPSSKRSGRSGRTWRCGRSRRNATLRRLNRAFAGFFRRVKASETPGYPRFKSAHRYSSVEWPVDGDGCRWQPDRHRVYLQGIGHVKASMHRQVHGRVKTIQIRRQGRRWMLVLSCDQVPTRPLAPTRAAVGIDVGIASFATTSDGEHFPNPRFGRAAAAKLSTAQQVLAASSGAPTTVAEPERQSRPGIASSPTSDATSTITRPGRSSPTMACWSWRT